MGLLGKIRRTGRVAEPAPLAPTGEAPAEFPAVLRGALALRHVDAGSCNGCEIEISGCFSPVYDVERYGVKLVASPRHADGLLVIYPMSVPSRRRERRPRGTHSPGWTALPHRAGSSRSSRPVGTQP